MSNKYLGFDIGGTAIKYGISNDKGDILYKSKIKTPRKSANLEIPKIIKKIYYNLNKDYNICGIGIATAGNLDLKENKVIYAASIKDYSGTNFNEQLKDLNIPIQIENDVNAQALAEKWVGSGKNLENFVMMSIGTGIGGAIIINDRIYRGVNFSSGEFGHMIISKGGKRCNCGRLGCAQSYSSTPKLSMEYTKITGKNIRGRGFFNKVKKKDPVALKIYNEFIFNVSVLISNVIIAIDPGVIILGGGISEQDILITSLNESVNNMLLDIYKGTKIIPASMGNSAGIVGASYVIKEKLL